MIKKEKSELKEIEKAANTLTKGGVVIFPTDTVFGIGCVFDNAKAKERIYRIKGTEKSQQFPILVANMKQAAEIAYIPPQTADLIKKHWPGALTVVVKAKNNKNIGLRMPDSKITLKLIELVQKPIVGTSANFHSKPSVGNYEDLDQKLITLVDYVLKGTCKKQKESTVVDATGEKLKVLRQGAVYL